MASDRAETTNLIESRRDFGLPHQRRRLWVELPGWVTAYLKERTDVRKVTTTTAEVYHHLCHLWTVPISFGVAEKDQTVYIISEALTKREGSRAIGLTTSYGQALAKEMLEVVEFLAENASAKTQRLGWLDPNLAEQLQRVSPSDWIVFPAPDMVHWLSDEIPKGTEKLLRHVPQQHPCKIGVFGNFNRSLAKPLINESGRPRRHFSAASMRFSQVWDSGVFLSVTSKAAASKPDGLRDLQSKIYRRSYDILENPSNYRQLVLWLHLHTYWLLSPPPITGTHVSRSISLIRAFNQIHSTDLPIIPIINKDYMDKGIRSILNCSESSLNLMAGDILKSLEIPRSEIPRIFETMNGIFERRDEKNEELRGIQETGCELIKTFWKFRSTLVVVSDEEFRHLPRSEVPWCQFVTFEILLQLIQDNLI